MTTPDAAPNAHRIVLVTGPSGAGRFTAIKILEDLGFESIDNLPLRLLPRLVEGQPLERSIALGVDVRNRDFSVGALSDALARLRSDMTLQAEMLYLDCRADVLARRFSETRRRHPIAPDGDPDAAIAQEITLLAPLRDEADTLIDTSELSPHDLRDALTRHYAPTGSQHLALGLQSFSYKRGLPIGLDMVLDVRFLANPHWDVALRAKDGRDAAVRRFVAADPTFAPFIVKTQDLLDHLLPAYIAEGKAHFTVGLGCTGGQHRSVAVAEQLGKALAEAGWRVSIRHRELERRVKTPG
ncbi:MAG: RNase adapter RapZ [Pseudomonadota bacterium]